MIETLSAILTSLIIIAISSLLSKHISQKLVAATMLCSIAFIYVGFALIGNEPVNIIWETSIALVFYFIAIIGYAKNSYWIAFGIILHGTWDLCHHLLIVVRTVVPDYWALYCGVADIILGVYYYLIFKRERKAIITSS